MDIKLGAHGISRQRLIKPMAETKVRLKKLSRDALSAGIGLSKSEDSKTFQVMEREEFEFFMQASRRGRLFPIVGSGVLLLDALTEGDALFSGRLSEPDMRDSPLGRQAKEANFYFPPEVASLLVSGEDEGALTQIARIGSADIIMSRVLGADVPDMEVDQSVYDICDQREEPIRRQFLHHTIRRYA